MKISYDSEVDALYIALVDGEHQVRTIRLSDEVALNIGAGEQLVGIEILDAKKMVGHGQIPNLLIDNIAYQVAAPR